MSASLPIKKLAIYYAWPSIVNGSTSTAQAIQVFSDYDIVVIGKDLENTTHPDHQNTKDIIAGCAAEFYGYVNGELSFTNVKQAVGKWCDIPGIAGIFVDRFGYDYGTNRTKQNKIIDYIHASGVKAFVNAWNPDDVFQSYQGVAHKLHAGDWYLAQSHYVINGQWQTVANWETKSDAMAAYKASSGVNMACITTTTASIGFDQSKWNAAYYAHTIYGFDASGWGEPLYSAPDALLPWRTRLPINGTKFAGSLNKNSGVFDRQTNIGITVDTSTHETSSLLN